MKGKRVGEGGVMGLYAIRCPACGTPHMWFSGNMDQRCHDCRPLHIGLTEAERAAINRALDRVDSRIPTSGDSAPEKVSKP